MNDHVGAYLTSKSLIYNVITVGIRSFSGPCLSRVRGEYGKIRINARAQSEYGKELSRKILHLDIFFK